MLLLILCDLIFFNLLTKPDNFALMYTMYNKVAPRHIVDKKTNIAVKNFSVNQFSIPELDKYNKFQNTINTTS